MVLSGWVKISDKKTQCYPLPAISAELVRELKKLGMKQTWIANVMGLTPSAVSQYVKGKRENVVPFDATVKRMIETSAGKIASGRISGDGIFGEICELYLLAWKCGTDEGAEHSRFRA